MDLQVVAIKALQLLCCLSLLVVLHEFGHYGFSKLFRVKVEKFYMFFNPKFHLFSTRDKWFTRLFPYFKNNETEYGIGWLPLGGYVKISGMVDESMDTEQMKQPAQPWEFRSQKVWKRFFIMAGGVIMNLITAWVIYSAVLFTWGHEYIPMRNITDGFQFNLKVSPVITGKAATMKFDLSGNSLLGWNSDGSARRSKSDISTTVQLPYTDQEFVLGGVRKSESVRGNTGLPFLKDLPIIGRLFSTETESIKQSQLVVIAKVEYSRPDSFAGAKIRENLGKIVKGVNKGMNSRVGNMFFGQYGLDSDRADRNKRLDDVGNKINDEYKTIK